MTLSMSTLLALSAALVAVQVSAHPEYVARLPNGANVPGVQALGHVDPSGGGSRNAFGKAFQSAGLAWTTELCKADSDGDGQTNGEELGDPCCVWVESSNAVLQWTDGVSHPGDASSTSNSSLWANITCTSTSDTETKSSTASSSSGSTVTATPTTTTSAPSTSSAGTVLTNGVIALAAASVALAALI